MNTVLHLMSETWDGKSYQTVVIMLNTDYILIKSTVLEIYSIYLCFPGKPAIYNYNQSLGVTPTLS